MPHSSISSLPPRVHRCGLDWLLSLPLLFCILRHWDWSIHTAGIRSNYHHRRISAFSTSHPTMQATAARCLLRAATRSKQVHRAVKPAAAPPSFARALSSTPARSSDALFVRECCHIASFLILRVALLILLVLRNLKDRDTDYVRVQEDGWA